MSNANAGITKLSDISRSSTVPPRCHAVYPWLMSHPTRANHQKYDERGVIHLIGSCSSSSSSGGGLINVERLLESGIVGVVITRLCGVTRLFVPKLQHHVSSVV